MIQFALMAVAAKRLGFERVKAVGRVVAYSTGVAILFGAVGAHKARAAMTETGYQVGQDLAAVAPFLNNQSTINVNGQRVHFSAAATNEGVTAVLDKFQATCQQAGGADATVWSSLPTTPEDIKALHADKLTQMPVLRQQQGSKGFVVCLVPTTSMTAESFRAATVGFIHDHKSLQLGRLRYATVNESPTGSSVVTVWTDENFDLGALVPDPDHDKPGVDPEVMLRPSDAVRMMSGTVEQLPYKVFLYDTKLSPKEAIDSYETKMIAQGWASIQVPQSMAMPHDGFELRSYMKDGFVGYVTASKSPKGTTIVGVGETAKLPPAGGSSKLSDADGF